MENRYHRKNSDHEWILRVFNIIEWLGRIVIASIIVFLVIYILGSCSPQKRLNRLLDKHPELKETQTLVIRDTIRTTVPGSKGDTVVSLLNISDSVGFNCDSDTARITEGLLSASAWVSGDSLYLEAECDTVYLEIPYEKTVEVEKIIYRKARDGLICFILIAIAAIFSYLLGILIERRRSDHSVRG
jgi:uncharacterized protein YneF (UPF0154 family)